MATETIKKTRGPYKKKDKPTTPKPIKETKVSVEQPVTRESLLEKALVTEQEISELLEEVITNQEEILDSYRRHTFFLLFLLAFSIVINIIQATN